MTPSSSPPYVLPIAARSRDALRRLAGDYARLFDGIAAGDPADLCAAAAAATPRPEHHLAVVADTTAALAARLRGFAEAPAGAVPGPDDRPRVVFVYAGQATRWAGMARRLIADEPAFGHAVAECDA